MITLREQLISTGALRPEGAKRQRPGVLAQNEAGRMQAALTIWFEEEQHVTRVVIANEAADLVVRQVLCRLVARHQPAAA